MSSYEPKADSAGGKLIAYLKRNPDAKMTSGEVAEAIGCQAKDLTALLSSVVSHRLVRTWHEEFGGAKCRMFGAGDQLNAQQAPAPAAVFKASEPKAEPTYVVPTGYVPRLSSPAPAAAAPTIREPAVDQVKAQITPPDAEHVKPAATRRKPLTREMVKVHSNLPKPQREIARGLYHDLLDALEVGHAISFPLAYQHALDGSARKLAKRTGRKFSTCKLNTTEAAIWRDK